MSFQIFNLLGISRDSTLENNTAQHLLMSDFIHKSETFGFSGILLPESIEGPINPWFFAQKLLATTERLLPFIAINPCFVHPLYVARSIVNLSSFYKRPIYLNFITGGSIADGLKINDTLSKEEKYNRVEEFMTIIEELLSPDRDTLYTFTGDYYRFDKVLFKGTLPKELQPVFHIAGSSKYVSSLLSKKEITHMQMAQSFDNITIPNNRKVSYHFGLIVRETEQEAQDILEKFCATDRKKTILQQISIQNSGSTWKKGMFEKYKNYSGDSIFNLIPFKNGYSDVPYLVGTHKDITVYLLKYLKKGIKDFVIEVPQTGHDEITEIYKSVIQIKKYKNKTSF